MEHPLQRGKPVGGGMPAGFAGIVLVPGSGGTSPPGTWVLVERELRAIQHPDERSGEFLSHTLTPPKCEGAHIRPVIIVQCLPWMPTPTTSGPAVNMMKRWPSEPNHALYAAAGSVEPM